MYRLAIASVAVPLAAKAEMAYAFGGGICAGADQDTTVLLGLKKASDCTAASQPPQYIKTSLKVMSMVKSTETEYLTAGTGDYTYTQNAKYQPIPPTLESQGSEYDRFTKSISIQTAPNGARYAEAAMGMTVGDISKTGADAANGFVGTASYLLLSNNITYKTNTFKVPSGYTASDVCVVDLAGGTTCPVANERTASVGAYKFSLFGYTKGDGFAAQVTSMGHTHMVIRQEWDLSGMGAGATVTFNDNSNTTTSDFGNMTMGATHISKISVTGAAGADQTTLSFTNPTTYNVGTWVADDVAKTVATTNVETKNVKIHAVSGPGALGPQKFYVDYVFEMVASLRTAGGYLVYDPEVGSPDIADPAAEPSSSAVSGDAGGPAAPAGGAGAGAGAGGDAASSAMGRASALALSALGALALVQ